MSGQAARRGQTNTFGGEKRKKKGKKKKKYSHLLYGSCARSSSLGSQAAQQQGRGGDVQQLSQETEAEIESWDLGGDT